MQKRRGVVNTFVVIFLLHYKKGLDPLQGVWHAEK